MNSKIKKIVLATAFMATAAFANDTAHSGMSNIEVGAGAADYNGVTGSSKFYMGATAMAPIYQDIYIGIGADVLAIEGPASSSASNGNYTLAGQLKVGYSLENLINWGVHLKAEYGYGITRFGDKNYNGSQYGFSVDSRIYKNLGAGYKYKSVNTGIDSSVFDTYTTNIFFVELTF